MTVRRAGDRSRARSPLVATLLFAALCMAVVMAALPVTIASTAVAQQAASVTIATAKRDGYARIIFDWAEPVAFRAVADGQQVTIEFGQSLQASPAILRDDLPELISDARLSGDGRTLTLMTQAAVSVRSFTAGSSAIIDIIPTDPTLVVAPAPADEPPEANDEVQRAPPSQAAAPQAAPAPAPTAVLPAVKPGGRVDNGAGAALPSVNVRTGTHPGYGRIVFDWQRTVDYQFRQDGTLLTVIFEAPARIDPTAVPNRLSAYVADAYSVVEGGRTHVAFTIATQARIRHFRIGNRVVVDIFRQLDDAARQAGRERAAQRAAGNVDGPARPVLKPASQGQARQPVAVNAADVDAEPVSLVGQVTPDGLVFDMSWQRPVAAAVFRRFQSVWMVFDRPGRIELDPVRQALGDRIESIEQWVAKDRTVLRVRTRGNLLPYVRRAGEMWHIELLMAPRLPDAAVEVTFGNDDQNGEKGVVLLRAGSAGSVMHFQDPDVGDELVVVPVMTSSRGVMPPRRFVEFDLLETGQGVVVKAKADNLVVETVPGGVQISTGEGLHLSARELHAEAEGRWDNIHADLYKKGGAGELSDPFKFAQFKRDPGQLIQSRQELQNQIADLPADKRGPYRINLARLLLANGLPAAAIGVLDAAVTAEPRLAQRGDVKMLNGAANFALGHMDEAVSRFNDPGFDKDTRAMMWRAAAAAARGQWERADRLFERSGLTPLDYPPYLRNRIDLLSIRAGLKPTTAHGLMMSSPTLIATA